MVRRGLLHIVVATALVAAAMTSAVAPAGASSTAANTSIALGVDLPQNQQTVSGVTNVENQIGHKLAFTREFDLWDSAFPTSYDNWLGARGTVLALSIKSRLANGTAVSWSSVADAQPGSTRYAQIVSWADRVKAYGYPMFFTYNHEPEAATNNDLGTPAEWIAAWRKIHDVFVAEGATNAHFLDIMTSYAYLVGSTDRRYGWNWYPGDDDVDAIAVDAYNFNNCRETNGKWQSLATAIAGFMRFGAQHPDKPMYLAEFASPEDPKTAGRKAQWITDAQALLKQPAYAQIAGVSYFDLTQGGYPNCNYPLTSSSTALSAFSAMAQDAYYQGTVSFTQAPPTDPDPTRITFVAGSSTTGFSTSESVPVPAGASAGDALVMIATSATPGTLTPPTGWTTVASTTSAVMSSAVFTKVAASTDLGATVKVTYPTSTKGSLELLGYAGTSVSGPVRSAVASFRDTSTSAISTPVITGAVSGDALVSFWAARTSTDTTITPPSSDAARSGESGTGGGRIVSASADSDPSTPGGHVAAVSPATGHTLAWSILLAGS